MNLKNLVERTVLVSSQDKLEVKDFMTHKQASPNKGKSGKLPAVGTMTLEEIEIAMIKKTLTFHRYNISKVARALGVSRAALYRRMDKYGIPYEHSH